MDRRVAYTQIVFLIQALSMSAVTVFFSCVKAGEPVVEAPEHQPIEFDPLEEGLDPYEYYNPYREHSLAPVPNRLYYPVTPPETRQPSPFPHEGPIDTHTVVGVVQLPATPGTIALFNQTLPIVNLPHGSAPGEDLTASHLGKVLTDINSLIHSMKTQQAQYGEQLFIIKTKIADLITNNFSSPLKNEQMHNLLNALIKQQEKIKADFATYKDNVTSINAAYTDSPHTTQLRQSIDIINQGSTALDDALQNLSVSLSDFYQQLVYNFALVKKTLVTAISMQDIASGKYDPEKWFADDPDETVNENVEVVDGFINFIQVGAVEAAEESEDMLECLTLAKKVANLESRFQVASQAFGLFAKKLIKDPKFEDVVKEIETEKDELQEENKSKCPFIAVRSHAVEEKIEEFLEKVKEEKLAEDPKLGSK